MRKFSPYVEAAGDTNMNRMATKQWWRGWCCKCNTEKPMAGGKMPGRKNGEPFRGGVVQRFICADCLAKRAALKEKQ